MLNIPNSISFFRVALAIFSVFFYLSNSNNLIFLSLTIIVIALDGLDGIIARKLNQCTDFGAKLDIYADRFVELMYWFFFCYLALIPYWVFGFFLIRGLAVDWLNRNKKGLGESWLRSSRFMRAFYGVIKLLSFLLLIIQPEINLAGLNISVLLTYLTVAVSALRALPAFFED